MKRLIIAAGTCVLISITACNKENNENLATTEQAAGPRKPGDHGSFTYRAKDGSRARVYFDHKKNTMSITSNNTTFELDDKGSGHYERRGITADRKGDSLIITQEENVIELVWDN
ncbi:hypothetical protein SAMN05443429_101276 [Cruoricaptor ignavus]|uniref:Membrane-bound lysozyme-inhibitor of c-type lysozyme n=1 Tax=Cruoricaptor ignavus TaxID=1118202 RepID=A0A1M6AFW2_9FLAO|nr:hypothetical protein [Cruoricaptor ignavus]SHI35355.1 hypothetical protein SAMN05443429_101276 [Cruoricaptor ignavus]